jgi:hypothetical protein
MEGLGVAGAVTGEHANQAPGMHIDKIAYVLGPRYTFALRSPHAGLPSVQLFGELLRRVEG